MEYLEDETFKGYRYDCSGFGKKYKDTRADKVIVLGTNMLKYLS